MIPRMFPTEKRWPVFLRAVHQLNVSSIAVLFLLKVRNVRRTTCLRLSLWQQTGREDERGGCGLDVCRCQP